MEQTEWLNILGWKTDDLDSIRWIGFSYIKQGKYQIAQTLFEAMEVLDPSNSYTLQTLGALYLENNNPYKALDILEKALKLDPVNENARFNKTLALLALGLKKQALSEAEALSTATNASIRSKAQAIVLSNLISA